MKVTVNNLKKLAIALVALPLLGVVLLNSSSVTVRATPDDFDAAAFFKAKCAMCHGAKVEKNFDATKADDVLTQTVLKGNKPKMPEYESKGVTADQAKALVGYMKSLKQ
jgi:cytochrome c5